MVRRFTTVVVTVGAAAVTAGPGVGQEVPDSAHHAAREAGRRLAELMVAAYSGDVPAQYGLGLMYATGEGGLPENDAEAVRWYRAAAEQGLAEAQWSLGRLYLTGEGVPENHVRAYAWWNLAGAQGHEGAREARSSLSSLMTSHQIADAQELKRGTPAPDRRTLRRPVASCPTSSSSTAVPSPRERLHPPVQALALPGAA